jgi:pilus assembly protein CpaF
MATIHSNSARDAISKLQTLPLLAGENISHDFIAPIVANSIDLIVHTTILRETGERKITEIGLVTGRVESGKSEIEPLFTYRQAKRSGSSKSVANFKAGTEESGFYEVGLGDPERVFERRRL